MLQAIELVLARGALAEIDISWKKDSGVERHSHISFVPEFDLNGAVTSVLTISRDISSLKKTEQSLRESERRFREIFDNSRDCLFLLEVLPDERFRNLEVNPAFEKAVGIARADLVGKTIQEAMPAEIAGPCIAKYHRCVTSGRMIEEETEMPLPAGLRLHRSTIIPVCDETGRVHRLVGISRDITEQRQMENQLRQAQKLEAIGLLAGGVAHDFNNTLAAILMHLGAIGSDPRLPTDLIEMFQELEDETRRAASLPRQLLLFSRRQVMQPQPLRWDELLGNILKMLRRLIGEKIQIEYRQAGQPFHIYADQGMMEQLVMNLCINARDAMPNGGRLILDSRVCKINEDYKRKVPDARAGKFVCLRVTDTGTGMDAATLSHIFEPFFTTKEAGRGTGLGLATVFGVVKQHQGWIEVQSAVGQGTTFAIYLPIHTRGRAAQPQLAAKNSVPGGQETILLVEDEAGVRRTTAITLRRKGYQVLEAADAGEALKIWEQQGTNIDLLLSDMMMPGEMTGLELAARLRQSKPGLKIILDSGYSAEMTAGGAPELKDVVYLPKPFTIKELTSVLRECLDGKK